MKRNLRFFSLLFCSSFAATLLHAQDRFAYAITDLNKDGANWNSLRILDLQTGTFGNVLLTGTDASRMAYDAATRKQMTTALKDERFGTVANAAFGTGVAAIAYDKKSNRLYYTPMFIDQLRYIDLKTMNVYFVNGAGLTTAKNKAADQSNIITRMAFASDGKGYALTNDGNELIQFTTGKTPRIIRMGALVDDPANKNVSIHNSCTSFGGDMIADDDGHLYVFSARNHVFRVDLQTRVATFLGVVRGLPANFTINGTAVDDDNRILITSAVDNSAMYAVTAQTLDATMITSAGPWRSSDLANSNLLQTRRPQQIPELLQSPTEIGNGDVRIYPNPVRNQRFSVQLGLESGNYTVQVTDVVGRQTVQAAIYIKSKGQTEQVQMPATTKSGVYLVKILDQHKQVLFSQKILVE